MNPNEQEIMHFIQELGFEVQREAIPQEEELDLSFLTLQLGEDQYKRKLHLQISLLEVEKKSFCQCFLPYPFQCKKEHFADLARCILLINKVAPLPGLGLSETDQMVLFQYIFPYSKQEFFDFFPLLISKILFIYEIYQPHLENIAVGKLSYEQLLNQAKEHLEAL